MDLYRCLQSFKAIIDCNGFAAAARKHYRPASQLSKEIAWLELELDAQLLIRTTRKLSITEAGEQVYLHAEQLSDNYQQLKLSLQEKQNMPSGKLTVSVPVAFAESVLSEKISNFMLAYPAIKLEMRFENRHVNLSEENIDLAIRAINHDKKSTRYDYQPFMKSTRNVFVAPSCLEKYGLPERPIDLEQYPCLIHSEMSPPQIWRFNQQLTATVEPRYICNNVKSLIDSAAKGLGCIYLSSHQYQLQAHLNSGELVPILSDYMPAPIELSFCTVKQTYLPQKIVAFIEFMKQQSNFTL